MQKGGWVYIMASKPNGSLYIGVTSDLLHRVWQHREGTGSEHVRRYEITRLVYVEQYDEIMPARVRERAMKAWRRAWKIALIEKDNPEWGICGRISKRGGLVEANVQTFDNVGLYQIHPLPQRKLGSTSGQYRLRGEVGPSFRWGNGYS